MERRSVLGTLRRIEWALRRRLAFGASRNHVVFRYDPERWVSCDLPDGMKITIDCAPDSFGKLSDTVMPNNLIQAEAQHRGGAKIAVATMDGSIAASAFYRRVDPWFIPLGARDVVIYAVVTERAAMGRGLAGILARAIAMETVQIGGDAFVDCAKWNTRAHRAFEKAGFVRNGSQTFAPISNAAQIN